MRALAMVLLFITGCEARFSGEVPRSYKCANAGRAECPGGWVCNQTVGFCFNPDSGLPLACANDDECGGGWRCSPNQVCVDRSVEGQLTVLEPAESASFLGPRLLRTGTIAMSSRAAAQVGLIRLSAFDVLLETAGRQQWFATHETVSLSEVKSFYRLFEGTAGAKSVVTTQPVLKADGVDFVHTLWSVVDGGVRARTLIADSTVDGGVGFKDRLIAGTYAAVGVVRSEGVAFENDALRGAALLIGPAGTEAWQFDSTVPNYRFAAGFTEVGWVDGRFSSGSGGCTQMVVALGAHGAVARAPVAVAAGTTALFSDGAPLMAMPSWSNELRVGVSLRADAVEVGSVLSTGEIASVNACTAKANKVDGCAQRSDGGLSWVAWNYHEVEAGLVPRVVCNGTGTQTVFNSPGSPTGSPVYDPFQVSTDGVTGVARTVGSHAVVQIDRDVNPTPLTMSTVPDGLTNSLGTVVALRRDGAYTLTEAGFMRAQANTDVSQNYAASDGRFSVSRNGVVSTTTWAVAFPPTLWNSPSAPVLMRTLPLADAGTLLALAHDDTIDMAQLRVATKTVVELAPMVVPAPGLAVTDFALRLSTDGGFATGYAIASGFLIALNATSPTRWQSARVTLPDDVLHVYYDGELPRAVSASGTVLGLTALVGLTPPTPWPRRRCAAPPS